MWQSRAKAQLVGVESENAMYLTMTHFAVRQIDLKFKSRLIFFLIISAFFLLLHRSLFLINFVGEIF